MSFDITFTSRFYEKMAQIAEYLAKNDYDIETLDRIKNDIKKRLGKNPNSGKLAEDVPSHLKNVRKIIVLKKNVVYYKIEPGKVIVLTIRAGKMDLEF